jgi:hypothetical protein
LPGRQHAASSPNFCFSPGILYRRRAAKKRGRRRDPCGTAERCARFLFVAGGVADLNKRRNFALLHQRLFSRAKTPPPPGAQRLHAAAALTEKVRERRNVRLRRKVWLQSSPKSDMMNASRTMAGE